MVLHKVSFKSKRGGTCTAPSKIGYARTQQQMIALVQDVVNKKRLDIKVTSGW